MVTLFNGADIKVEVANFCAAMDTLIDQDYCSPRVVHAVKNNASCHTIEMHIEGNRVRVSLVRVTNV